MDENDFAAKLEQRFAAIDNPPAAEPEAEAEVETPVEEPAVEEPAAEEEAPVADSADEAADAAEAELPDDASDEEIEAARAEAEEKFYAGTYRTREEAEAGIAQKDSTIGRMGQELGELRKEIAAKTAQQEQAQQEPAQLDVRQWEEWAEQTVEQGAGEAGALKALEVGGYPGYEIYLKQWMRDPEQAPDALTFNNSLMIEMTEQRARAAAQPREEEQAAKSQQEEAEWAREEAVKRYPGFADDEERMASVLQEMDEGDRQFLVGLAQQGREGKLRALRHLHLETISRGVSSQQRAQAVEQARRKTAGDAAKVGATVASSEARNARTPLTEDELVRIRYANERRKEWGLPLVPEE